MSWMAEKENAIVEFLPAVPREAIGKKSLGHYIGSPAPSSQKPWARSSYFLFGSLPTSSLGPQSLPGNQVYI